jgi:hypothetical protein
MTAVPGNWPANMRVKITGCARCGEDHPDLEFHELANHERYAYYATCPTNGQPLLSRIVEIPAPAIVDDEPPT